MSMTNETAKYLRFLCFGLCITMLGACASKNGTPAILSADIIINDQSPTTLDEIVFKSLNFSQLSCLVIYEETASIEIAPAILSTTTFEPGEYHNVTIFLNRKTTTNEKLTITAYENRCKIKSDYIFGETQLENKNILAIKKINVNLMADISIVHEVYSS